MVLTADCVIERSADVLTEVVAVAELLLDDESTVLVLTAAVFDTVPVADGDTVVTIVIVAVPPLATKPNAHVTVVVPEQLPCDGVAETRLTEAGSASLTLTLAAIDGPALPTVSV
jgi:hypothetical protein